MLSNHKLFLKMSYFINSIIICLPECSYRMNWHHTYFAGDTHLYRCNFVCFLVQNPILYQQAHHHWILVDNQYIDIQEPNCDILGNMDFHHTIIEMIDTSMNADHSYCEIIQKHKR